jgi:hypothetical protein
MKTKTKNDPQVAVTDEMVPPPVELENPFVDELDEAAVATAEAAGAVLESVSTTVEPSAPVEQVPVSSASDQVRIIALARVTKLAHTLGMTLPEDASIDELTGPMFILDVLQVLADGHVAKKSARSQFERKIESNDVWAQVRALPTFERCSCGTPLAAGEKCNQHGQYGNAEHLCPVAFKASKMIACHVPKERVLSNLGIKVK